MPAIYEAEICEKGKLDSMFERVHVFAGTFNEAANEVLRYMDLNSTVDMEISSMRLMDEINLINGDAA